MRETERISCLGELFARINETVNTLGDIYVIYAEKVIEGLNVNIKDFRKVAASIEAPFEKVIVIVLEFAEF